MSDHDSGRPEDAERPGNDERPWHFLQTRLWASHKERFGWEAVAVEAPGSPGFVRTLSRRLGGGVLFTYVPYGPAGQTDTGVPGPPVAELPALLGDLSDRVALGVKDSVGTTPAVVRFDLPQASRDAAEGLFAAGLRPAPVEVQPRDTVVLDLRASEAELLEGMHKKNRYNIRLAERKGVTVRTADTASEEAVKSAIERWYALYRVTADRDRIAIHSREYYERFLLAAIDDDELDVRLSFAEHEGDLLAGIIVVRYGAGATYLYGASSNEKRSLMPNYALQWQAIVDARRYGCRWYDLFGVPPAADSSHPMHGLYRFKTGFGGEVIHRLGAWDSIRKPIIGHGFRLAERTRDIYVHRVRRNAR